MGLFSKKKPEEKEELPPLTFPELPKKGLPEYKPAIEPRMEDEPEEIKKAVKPSEFSFDIPKRKPLPDIFSEKSIEPAEKYREGRTMFVKIQHYKDAMRTMDEVKDKLAEAEKILRKLDQLKEQENNEIAMWHQDLENIKQKLLSIDKTLFE